MGKNFHRNSLVFTMANERGIALVIGLIIMMLLVVLGGIMLYVTRTEIKVTSNYEQSVQALHAAEAGAEKVYDAFKRGDTNGDKIVDGSDVANANNDLDDDGIIDFIQVFVTGLRMPLDGSECGTEIIDGGIEVEVNSGDTRAFVWVDACDFPGAVIINSRGSPDGTNARREVALTIGNEATDIIGGSLNNSVPDGSP